MTSLSDIPVKYFCPLGKECEKIETSEKGEPYISRCVWFQKFAGQDPLTGEDKEESGCAIPWMNVSNFEVAKQNRHVGASIDAFRHEMTQAQKQTENILTAASELRLKMLSKNV